MDIIEDEQGRILVSCFNGQLCRTINPVDGNSLGNLKFERLGDRMALKDEGGITTMFRDDRGYIWFGTERSVFVYNPVTEQYIKVKLTNNDEIIKNMGCRIIGQPESNTIIICGRKNVLLQDPWKEIRSNKSISLNVTPLLEELSLTLLEQYQSIAF